jgi:adenosylcobinamide-GDP ribazoletransferase
VGLPGAVLALLLVLVAVVLAVVLGRPDLDGVHTVALLVPPLLAAGLLGWRCVRRFGGVTGDVLGACVETAFTTALVGACL